MSKGVNETILTKIIESTNQPIFLYQLKVNDPVYGTIYHRFAGNQTENITFNGFSWQAVSISHDPIDITNNLSIDQTTIRLAGISSELISYLSTDNNSLNGYEVTIMRVFRDTLEDPNNYILEFVGEIDGYSYDGIWISVNVRRQLGTFSKSIPRETYGSLCPLQFKGTVCGYTGSTPTCDRTATACVNMAGGSNMVNFGGFPWVPAAPKK